ncbi:MAG: Crp/Fnr family transcriptional regulator, partial [Chloroflexota bacterium]
PLGAMSRPDQPSESAVSFGDEDNLTELLRLVPVFATLEGVHLQQLAREMTRREVTKGELVTVEGQPAEGLFVVASGRLKRFKVSQGGHEQILKFLQPGESFGEVPLLDGGPDPASTEAMERGVVFVLPVSRFEHLVQQSPDLALGLIRFLAGRLRHFTQLVEDLSFLHRTQRVAKLVLERTAVGDLNRLTQSDMAAAAGTAREVVGRALRELEMRGAIQVEHGRITVQNQVQLEAIAGVEAE